jgi:hypothetical protein
MIKETKKMSLTTSNNLMTHDTNFNKIAFSN